MLSPSVWEHYIVVDQRDRRHNASVIVADTYLSGWNAYRLLTRRLYCWNLKINAPRSFEKSGTIYPTLQVGILEDLNFRILLSSQQSLQHTILARKVKERNNLEDPVADHKIVQAFILILDTTRVGSLGIWTSSWLHFYVIYGHINSEAEIELLNHLRQIP
jgi:hypothetical protein